VPLHPSSEVDEAHAYKNLQTVSNIPGAAIAGSQRASDLHMKTEYLRERHGGRVITMATATPIANSITEAYVMQRYLRPDLFVVAGVEHFDAWAATFAQTVTQIEMAPTGGGNYPWQPASRGFRTCRRRCGCGTCLPTSRPARIAATVPSGSRSIAK
jgi:hypothetical protein